MFIFSRSVPCKGSPTPQLHFQWGKNWMHLRSVQSWGETRPHQAHPGHGPVKKVGWKFQPEPTDEINMTKMKIRHLRGGLSRARLGYFGMVPGSCLRMPLIVNSRLSKAWVVASHPLHLWLRAMGLIRHMFSIVFFMFHLNSYTTQILFVPAHIVQWGWPPLAYHHFTIIAKGSSSSFCSFFGLFPE